MKTETRIAGAACRTGVLLATLATGSCGEADGRPDPDGGATGDAGGIDAGAADAGVARDAGPMDPARVYFKAFNTGALDRFGQNVAMSGDLIAIGAVAEDSDARDVDGDEENDRLEDAGAVYVYRRVDGVWTRDGYLKPPNPGADDRFGDALALDGDLLVVGVPAEDSSGQGVGADPFDDDRDGSGAVYLFRRGPGGWALEAFLKASNPGIRDGFGGAVAVSGDVVVVGAADEDSLSGGDPEADESPSAGAAYVFRRTDGDWVQESLLKPDVGGDDDRFGTEVAIDGDVVAIAAPGEDAGTDDPEDGGAESSGAVYVFRRGESGWAQEAFLKSDNPRFLDSFGGAVTIDGDAIAVGAPIETSSGSGVNPEDDDDPTGIATGAAYVFRRTEGSWTQEAYLKASNPDASDGFGSVCTLRGDRLACSAPQEASSAGFGSPDPEDDRTPGAGAVYLYRRDPVDGWTFEAFVKPHRPFMMGFFGVTIGMDGDAVLIGQPGEGSAATGVDGDAFDTGSVGAGAALLVPFDVAAEPAP